MFLGLFASATCGFVFTILGLGVDACEFLVFDLPGFGVCVDCFELVCFVIKFGTGWFWIWFVLVILVGNFGCGLL